jgi:hypothetical protein
MRLLSSIGLAVLLGGSCLMGAAHANTIDFGFVPLGGTFSYTGANLPASTAFDIGGGTLLVNSKGGSDNSGLPLGSTLVTISPTNIQYGSGVDVVSTPLVASLTKSWTDTLGAFTEVLTTVDYIGRGAPNAVLVVLQGLINGPGFSNATVFLELNANQVGGSGTSISWSATESSTNPVNPTPLPAALPLFATGLGALGLLARRKKRKGAAALAAA